jgi:hypothetical protein
MPSVFVASKDFYIISVRQVVVSLVMLEQNSRLSLVDNLVPDDVAVFGVSLILVRNDIL